jgi:hypothetical protein
MKVIIIIAGPLFCGSCTRLNLQHHRAIGESDLACGVV